MAQLIIALDRPDAAQAIDLVDRLGDDADFYKVGMELFTAAGPSVVQALRDRGKRDFLDQKYHDIPNTVASAVRASVPSGAGGLPICCGSKTSTVTRAPGTGVAAGSVTRTWSSA